MHARRRWRTGDRLDLVTPQRSVGRPAVPERDGGAARDPALSRDEGVNLAGIKRIIDSLIRPRALQARIPDGDELSRSDRDLAVVPRAAVVVQSGDEPRRMSALSKSAA